MRISEETTTTVVFLSTQLVFVVFLAVRFVLFFASVLCSCFWWSASSCSLPPFFYAHVDSFYWCSSIAW